MTASSIAVVYSASLLEARYKFPSPSPLLALSYLLEHHSHTKIAQRVLYGLPFSLEDRKKI